MTHLLKFRSWRIRTRYLVGGVLFGLCFPIVALVWECIRTTGGFSLSKCMEIHHDNQLLWIIDMAPIVIGFFSWTVGKAIERIIAEQGKRRKEVEVFVQKLSKQNEELSLLNKGLDDLLYSASHDLKTPAVNMKGLVSMMRMVIDDPDQQAMIPEILDRMELTSNRMRDLTSDLQDITRIEKGEFEPKTSIDLQRTVDHVWVSLHAETKRKGDRLEIDVKEAPTLQFPSSSWETILQNLISNSIKYADESRDLLVSIRSRKVAGGIEVDVGDNGVGIDLNLHKSKMFKMFKRFQNAQEGTGVGLYIIKRTMDHVGGTISVKSEVGKGTCFTLMIPD